MGFWLMQRVGGDPITEIVMNAERPRVGGEETKLSLGYVNFKYPFSISNQRIQVIG